MVGILVFGDNHFIVAGPPPDEASVLALVRHWTIIQIGENTPPELAQWTIRSREFRENLEWAVVVPADTAISNGVAELLGELAGRGITIRTTRAPK